VTFSSGGAAAGGASVAFNLRARSNTREPTHPAPERGDATRRLVVCARTRCTDWLRRGAEREASADAQCYC